MATDGEGRRPFLVSAAMIQIELRDLPRFKQLVWELRVLEDQLPETGGVLGAERLRRIVDRFFADMAEDEAE